MGEKFGRFRERLLAVPPGANYNPYASMTRGVPRAFRRTGSRDPNDRPGLALWTRSPASSPPPRRRVRLSPLPPPSERKFPRTRPRHRPGTVAVRVVCEGSAARPDDGLGDAGGPDRTVSGRSEYGIAVGENGACGRPISGAGVLELWPWIRPRAGAETSTSTRHDAGSPGCTRFRLNCGRDKTVTGPLAPSRLLPTFPIGGGHP